MKIVSAGSASVGCFLSGWSFLLNPPSSVKVINRKCMKQTVRFSELEAVSAFSNPTEKPTSLGWISFGDKFDQLELVGFPQPFFPRIWVIGIACWMHALILPSGPMTYGRCLPKSQGYFLIRSQYSQYVDKRSATRSSFILGLQMHSSLLLKI